ncbi:MAG: 4Fe-4S binding protein, partial [Leptospirales bacterium]|nr:4Fe-4S binding protein [Leptospirales bacterium]
LGFQGKNTNLIHPGRGSFFFISVLLLSVELEPTRPERDRCGSCRLCIDACPTSALSEYKLDAQKCISYLTIESKEPTDPVTRAGWSFGCDICQDVCPYNRSQSIAANWFPPRAEISSLMESGVIKDWEELSRESPLSRVSEDKFRNNLETV